MTVQDWSQFALVAAGVFAVSALCTPFIEDDSIARVLYWVFAYLGITCLAVFATPQGWFAAAGAAATGIAFAVGNAFFNTRFVKIKGRVYTAEAENPSEHNSYDGRYTAALAWWSMALGSCLVAAGLIVTRWMPPMFGFVAFGALISLMFGYDDGARGLPYARGQRLPFRIAAAASVVALGIPLLCYLAGYRRGSRRPGYGKHDAVRKRRARLEGR